MFLPKVKSSLISISFAQKNLIWVGESCFFVKLCWRRAETFLISLFGKNVFRVKKFGGELAVGDCCFLRKKGPRRDFRRRDTLVPCYVQYFLELLLLLVL